MKAPEAPTREIRVFVPIYEDRAGVRTEGSIHKRAMVRCHECARFAHFAVAYDGELHDQCDAVRRNTGWLIRDDASFCPSHAGTA